MSAMSLLQAAVNKKLPPQDATQLQLADTEYKALEDRCGYNQGRMSKIAANQNMAKARKKKLTSTTSAAATATTTTSSAAASPIDDGDASVADEEKNRLVRAAGHGLLEFCGPGPVHGRFTQFSSCWPTQTPLHVFQSGTQVHTTL